MSRPNVVHVMAIICLSLLNATLAKPPALSESCDWSSKLATVTLAADTTGSDDVSIDYQTIDGCSPHGSDDDSDVIADTVPSTVTLLYTGRVIDTACEPMADYRVTLSVSDTSTSAATENRKLAHAATVVKNSQLLAEVCSGEITTDEQGYFRVRLAVPGNTRALKVKVGTEHAQQHVKQHCSEQQQQQEEEEKQSNDIDDVVTAADCDVITLPATSSPSLEITTTINAVRLLVVTTDAAPAAPAEPVRTRRDVERYNRRETPAEWIHRCLVRMARMSSADGGDDCSRYGGYSGDEDDDIFDDDDDNDLLDESEYDVSSDNNNDDEKRAWDANHVGWLRKRSGLWDDGDLRWIKRGEEVDDWLKRGWGDSGMNWLRKRNVPNGSSSDHDVNDEWCRESYNAGVHAALTLLYGNQDGSGDDYDGDAGTGMRRLRKKRDVSVEPAIAHAAGETGDPDWARSLQSELSKKSWGESGMDWMKRQHEQQKRWADAQMQWMKRSQLDKRSWSEAHTEWMKRNVDDKRSWGDAQMDWMKRNGLDKRPWGEAQMEWMKRSPWNDAHMDWMKRSPWGEAQMKWIKRSPWSDAQMNWMKKSWGESPMEWMKRNSLERRSWGDAQMEWMKRNVDPKRSWGDAQMEWMKRNVEDKKSWGDSQMEWMKRHMDEKRSWGDAQMEWMKRSAEDANLISDKSTSNSEEATSSEVAPLRSGTTTALTSKLEANKRSWSEARMDWLKRAEDDKRSWSEAEMDWMKRQQEKRSWADSQMTWMKRARMAAEKRDAERKKRSLGPVARTLILKRLLSSEPMHS